MGGVSVVSGGVVVFLPVSCRVGRWVPVKELCDLCVKHPWGFGGRWPRLFVTRTWQTVPAWPFPSNLGPESTRNGYRGSAHVTHTHSVSRTTTGSSQSHAGSSWSHAGSSWSHTGSSWSHTGSSRSHTVCSQSHTCHAIKGPS